MCVCVGDVLAMSVGVAASQQPKLCQAVGGFWIAIANRVSSGSPSWISPFAGWSMVVAVRGAVLVSIGSPKWKDQTQQCKPNHATGMGAEPADDPSNKQDNTRIRWGIRAHSDALSCNRWSAPALVG